MALDVAEIDRRRDLRPLIELARIAPEIGVIDDAPVYVKATALRSRNYGAYEVSTTSSPVEEDVSPTVYASQAAYEEAVSPLFETLDWLEAHLSTNRYLCGDRITEADWRLFTTLIRFDSVYHGHFKCNIRRIIDYPNIWAYTRELYQWPKVAETVNFQHIKSHYYQSHRSVNPTGIVPIGPSIDFAAPHARGEEP